LVAQRAAAALETVMERLSIVDYARVIWRARYVIAGMVATACIIAVIVGSFQPRLYAATSTILAPRDNKSGGMSGALSSLLGTASRDGGGISFPGFQVAMPGLASDLDIFTTLLMSRTMREEVMAEFAKQRGPEAVAKIRQVGTSSTKDKTTLSVIVQATDAQLAADVANAYFEFLDRRLQRAAETQGKRQEVFYRAQLERAAREVDQAEEALVKFQQQNRLVPQIDPNAKANAESGANLRGQIMSLELQRELFRMRYTEQHPQMREVEKQISELKKQYSQNLFGQAMDLPPDSPGGKRRKEYFVSTERMTPTQFAYLKLFRNLKIQEAFYTGALQGLENMRYATEAGRPQGIEMLDPAVVPTTPISPNLRLIIFAAAVGTLVVGVVGALVRETLVQMHTARRPAVSAPRPNRARPRTTAANGTAVSEVPVSTISKTEPVA
jgi:uncharacterized protein involved in exopolysaccharide biosynthesis